MPTGLQALYAGRGKNSRSQTKTQMILAEATSLDSIFPASDRDAAKECKPKLPNLGVAVLPFSLLRVVPTDFVDAPADE